jgi:hypothetical protein
VHAFNEILPTINEIFIRRVGEDNIRQAAASAGA